MDCTCGHPEVLHRRGRSGEPECLGSPECGCTEFEPLPTITTEDTQIAMEENELGRTLAMQWLENIPDCGGGELSVGVAACDYLFAMLLVGADNITTPTDLQGHLVSDEDRLKLHVKTIKIYAQMMRETIQNHSHGRH